MKNSNFGIGALHVNRQILTYFFCDDISILTQVFTVLFDSVYDSMTSLGDVIPCLSIEDINMSTLAAKCQTDSFNIN